MEKYKYQPEELTLIENSSVPVAVYQFINKRVVTIAVSVGFCEMIGLGSLEEAYNLMDKDMYRDVHPDDIAEIADAAVRFATDKDEYNVVYRSKVREDYIILHAIGKHIYKENGTRLAVINYVNEGVYEDDHSTSVPGFNIVLNRYFQNKNASANLNYDHLTGLPNMNYFFELADAYHAEAMKEDRKLVMMFLNLSGMKAYNQRYGYSEGDLLIKETAKLLVKTFGNYNCCRTTADHFAVYDDKNGIEEKLKDLINDFKLINGGKNLPIKIGLYDTEYGEVDPATATDRAKIACDSCGTVLEAAVVCFDKQMLKDFEDRRYIFENLDTAMKEGWLKVHYQPIVRTSNGKVCNEEALVRWEDPQRGLMYPNKFIPILEDAKIAYRLDLFVTDQVIAKLKKQADAGISIVPNSINLSRTDFYSCDIVEEIRKRVDDAGIDRRMIIIELTESIIISDTDFMMSQIKRFKDLGFNIWLDDFGRGYSTPDLLQKIHFDVIKLDKSYIDQLETNKDSRIIVSELVRLANGLGSETVAEGIENDKSIEFLSEIGCTKLQGFYYSKALPFSTLLSRYDAGTQIGLENPNEADYYSTIGNMNLYDISFSSDEETDSLNDYFDTMPMFIVEVRNKEIRHLKGNVSYKKFMKEHYPSFTAPNNGYASGSHDKNFFNAILQCKEEGKPVITDLKGPHNDLFHLLIRKLATNSESGAVALSIVILSYVDNDAELRHKEELKRIMQERQIYARITSLTGDFITIYSVDPDNDHFIRYALADNYKYLGLSNEGDDFYEKLRAKALKNVYLDDIDQFLALFTKDNIIKAIENNGVFSINLRLMHKGKPRYSRIKATIIEEDSGPRLIIGIIDTDSQMRKDQTYYKTLAEMSKIANYDSLTGVKNKHAYIDAEAKLNSLIEENESPDFAIIVFDLNGLKIINDTFGHQSGDQFIKDGCKLICDYFQHSPVYRIGGDEFVAIAQDHDYLHLDEIMNSFKQKILENLHHRKVVIASGSAVYSGDRNVAAVFDRADKEMYDDKNQLKGIKSLNYSKS